jgi:hypothetical protein
MSENAPAPEEWRELYEAAIRVKELAPWQWMKENDTFGVQNPETGVNGFVSVMGTLGEHYAAALYLGGQALYRLWDLEDSGPLADPRQLLDIPQLQASFEDREQLDARDRATIKALGLTFRGRQSWPQFRSYRPGYFPWYLETDEARFLAVALGQLCEVAPRFKADPSLFTVPDDEHHFVRVPRKEGDSLVWKDKVLHVPFEEKVYLDIPMDTAALNYLRTLLASKRQVEIDFFMLRARIQENRNERPVMPYALLCVDAQSGMVLDVQLLEARPSLEAMWAMLPAQVVQQLATLHLRPAAVRVRSDMLHQMLTPVSNSLGFKLIKRSHLRMLDPAKASLLEYM